MQFQVRNLTEEDARQICAWRYIEAYSVYNLPDWTSLTQHRWGLAQASVRQQEFTAIVNMEDELCGYFRLKEHREYVSLGIGMRPDLCGCGYGSEGMELLKQEAKRRYPHKKLMLEVRAFNERAIRCYQKAGFWSVDIYERDTLTGRDKFVVMEMQAGS